jgi:hypothetical protein
LSIAASALISIAMQSSEPRGTHPINLQTPILPIGGLRLETVVTESSWASLCESVNIAA